LLAGEIGSWHEVKRNADSFLAVPSEQQVGRVWFLGMIGESDRAYTYRQRLWQGKVASR
jgi:hypothetical protein